MQPLKRSDLKVGTPLPWPVYDSQGTLLLKKGYIIQSQAQLESLFARGLHAPGAGGDAHHNLSHEQDTRPSSPFAEHPLLIQSLQTLLKLEATSEDLKKRLLGLVQRIATMCDKDPEASLALVHLNVLPDQQEQMLAPYQQVLRHAILCHFMGRQLQFESNRHTLQVAAALLANVALVPFQTQLNALAHPLTDKQRQIVNRHPLLACEALRKAGLGQSQLLHIVVQHHERFDGQGYPEQLRGEEIRLEARVLGLAEHYVAIISPRAYRPNQTASDAQNLILTSMAEDPEQSVYEALFDRLGHWPPGTLVRLVNGEIALVTRPGSHTVQAILKPSGEPYMGGMRRNTQEDEYRVANAVTMEKMPPLNFSVLWGYG